MSMKRRTFLKGTLASGALGVALSAGVLKPKAAWAAYPTDAFEKENVNDALNSLFGSTSTADGDIQIKAPDIAENGAVVPVSVSTSMSGVDTISIMVEKNPSPLAASFDIASNTEGFVSTRIKMGETSDVIAVVKSNGKLYSTRKPVKVTIGGCGG